MLKLLLMIWCTCSLPWGPVYQELMRGLFYSRHTSIKRVRVYCLLKEVTWKGDPFFMAGNSPSTQVPCLKSTVLVFSSPPAPAPAFRAFISLYNNDINKPDSSVGHSTYMLNVFPGVCMQIAQSSAGTGITLLWTDPMCKLNSTVMLSSCSVKTNIHIRYMKPYSPSLYLISYCFLRKQCLLANMYTVRFLVTRNSWNHPLVKLVTFVINHFVLSQTIDILPRIFFLV